MKMHENGLLRQKDDANNNNNKQTNTKLEYREGKVEMDRTEKPRVNPFLTKCVQLNYLPCNMSVGLTNSVSCPVDRIVNDEESLPLVSVSTGFTSLLSVQNDVRMNQERAEIRQFIELFYGKLLTIFSVETDLCHYHSIMLKRKFTTHICCETMSGLEQGRSKRKRRVCAGCTCTPSSKRERW